MNKNTLRSLLILVALLGVSVAALAWAKSESRSPSSTPGARTSSSGALSLEARLTQTKIMHGGDGLVSLALTLRGADPVHGEDEDAASLPVDMIIVLDRSGSMNGTNISDAKAAIRALISRMRERDRIALVSYSNTAQVHCNLLQATAANHGLLLDAVNGIEAYGGTNLGEGLRLGMDLLAGAQRQNRNARLLLISDGKANQGITGIPELSVMAARAVPGEFAVSTVGVGLDFNQRLLTAIADHGAGSYHYLEQPEAFAQVFLREFMAARTAVARNCAVSIPVGSGVYLVEAGGYPIRHEGAAAVFHPGEVLAGQSRTIFLTLRVPVDKPGDVTIPAPTIRFDGDAGPVTLGLPEPLHLACVRNEGEVLASLDKDAWERKVLQEDYSRLQEHVAQDIASGDESSALRRIESYRQEQLRLNQVLDSKKVKDNLEQDLGALRQKVEESMYAPAAVAPEMRNSSAKKLQHEGYANRRAKTVENQ